MKTRNRKSMMKRFSLFFLVGALCLMLAYGHWHFFRPTPLGVQHTLSQRIQAVKHLFHPTPPNFPHRQQPILIAHAGGAIDGHTYTNSREAVEQALQQGFSFIELDMSVTPQDRMIVAVHNWKKFLQQTGLELAEEDIAYAAIKNSRIYGKYTLLSAEAINALFAEKTTAWLVTDKTTDISLLLEQIDVPRERMLVEVFSYRAYRKAIESGIRYPMLCVWNIDSLRKLDLLFSMKKITMITMPIDLLVSAPDDIEKLYESGVAIFAFTSNDRDFIMEHINKRVTGFYTDTVLPHHVFAR